MSNSIGKKSVPEADGSNKNSVFNLCNNEFNHICRL